MRVSVVGKIRSPRRSCGVIPVYDDDKENEIVKSVEVGVVKRYSGICACVVPLGARPPSPPCECDEAKGSP